ncbi:hypothetical protein BC826DRAFT_165340 [Russula brevipes]|nr:hypothetical protein BC826DRAFT_165340 [Russula brevipes]
MSTYNLWCLIEGKTPFLVTALSTMPISVLKKVIKEENSNLLQKVDAPNLILWKVDVNIDTVGDKIRMGEYKPDVTGEQQLWNMAKLSTIWSEPPPDDHIHVFVDLPIKLSPIIQQTGDASTGSSAGDQPPSKRQRTDSSSLEQDLRPFWNRLWNQNADLVQTIPVVRDPDPVTDVTVGPTITVLHGLPPVFSRVPVLLRKQYEDAYRVVMSSCGPYGGGVIITGHPGIGKTMFLYYLLVLRLRNRQPTFFQYSPGFVILFDNRGVRVVSPVIGDPDAPNEAWALIDSNIHVKSVPWIFATSDCPNFIVVAASPRSERWKSLFHNRSDTKLWIMEPFTLEELFQARVLQMKQPREQDILTFFVTYGPSARDCFLSCSDLADYDQRIRNQIMKMSWDTLTAALSRGISETSFDDGSHKVILVAPQPEVHFSAQVTVVTKYVTQLLWNKDAIARRQNLRQMYSTLSQIPLSKARKGHVRKRPFFTYQKSQSFTEVGM